MEDTPQRTNIVAAQETENWSRGFWAARFEGRDSPIAYGATKEEAVEKLKMHFPSLVEEGR